MSAQIESESMSSQPAFPVRHFSVEEYHRLAEVGVLTEADRVELLEGVISPKMVHSPIHDATVSIIEQLLRPFLLPQWFLRIQSSITLQSSEPEPDIAVVKGPPQQYASRHPGGSDIALAIEVAETSLLRDQAKATTYSGGRIGCYWIVDLRNRVIEVHDGIENDAYSQCRRFQVKESIKGGIAFEGGTEFSVSDLFL
ncbi:hypothetical protein LF1_23680 [Rubripirellula obstinata]|uniref:Putative restriction endonuclease domain-containing protein n=2 Tax=Rubripirellula obstinata TaxID=406547 RepID=A0A5B1CHY4_9BACT|nr:Uma2 family endonuclease [Rubripirellula obstinata]KAA1259831.1 hypothetical protein LF1_23680 [Rubripirellula obstinata]